MVYTHSIDLFCTETEDSLPLPDSPHSSVSSITETEIWARDAEEMHEEEVEWIGCSEPAPHQFVSYADDRIEISPDYLCKVSYRCCLCDMSHDFGETLKPRYFDPTSLTFKFGKPPVVSIVAPCSFPGNPTKIELSFHRWQMRGAQTVFTSPLIGAAAGSMEAGGGAAAAVMSTPPQSRKRRAEEPGAPPRARGSSFVSESTDDVRERLSARF